MNVNCITLYTPTEFIFKQITWRLEKLFWINTYTSHAQLQILTPQNTGVFWGRGAYAQKHASSKLLR